METAGIEPASEKELLPASTYIGCVSFSRCVSRSRVAHRYSRKDCSPPRRERGPVRDSLWSGSPLFENDAVRRPQQGGGERQRTAYLSSQCITMICTYIYGPAVLSRRIGIPLSGTSLPETRYAANNFSLPSKPNSSPYILYGKRYKNYPYFAKTLCHI